MSSAFGHKSFRPQSFLHSSRASTSFVCFWHQSPWHPASHRSRWLRPMNVSAWYGWHARQDGGSPSGSGSWIWTTLPKICQWEAVSPNALAGSMTDGSKRLRDEGSASKMVTYAPAGSGHDVMKNVPMPSTGYPVGAPSPSVALPDGVPTVERWGQTLVSFGKFKDAKDICRAFRLHGCIHCVLSELLCVPLQEWISGSERPCFVLQGPWFE